MEILAPKVERNQSIVEGGPTLEETPKPFWTRLWPVIACGVGLFSDGYINGVSGTISFLIGKQYGDIWNNSKVKANFGSIIFVGIVLGQLIFGWTSDHWSRKWSLLLTTAMLFVFNALATGAYGVGGPSGIFASLTAWRFLTGIAIGGEYPSGSVSCSESTGELKSGQRNRWFVLFTNCAIDVGFAVATTVTIVVILITGENNPGTAWRVILGLGCVTPLTLIIARWKLQEPEAFKRESMSRTKTPWYLVFKLYWFRLIIVGSIWFIYDFGAYGFNFYSTPITDSVLSSDAPLWQVFGWNTVINCFYIPGAYAGAFVSDWIGPRKTLFIGVALQAIIGFIMAGVYPILSQSKYIGGFAVVYGVFLSLGEFGPGDCIGLIASKTCATPIRGQYYGIAAATGKIGAYVAIWAFQAIQDNASSVNVGQQNLFWVGSSLAVLAAALTWFFLPEVGQDSIDHEDRRFRAYLMEHGYDVSQMGLVDNAASMGHAYEIEKIVESPKAA